MNFVSALFGVIIGALVTYVANLELDRQKRIRQIRTARNTLRIAIQSDAVLIGKYGDLHERATQSIHSRFELQSFILTSKDLLLPAIQPYPSFLADKLSDDDIKKLIDALHQLSVAVLLAANGAPAGDLADSLKKAQSKCNEAANLL